MDQIITTTNNPSIMTFFLSASLAFSAIMVLAAYRFWQRYNALLDLIANSAPVCYLCGRGETGHDILSQHESEDAYHTYMPGVLVYLPEDAPPVTPGAPWAR